MRVSLGKWKLRLGEAWKKEWTRLQRGNLWKRILKNCVALTVTIVLSLLNLPHSHFGSASYLATMFAVFAHPGRRVGQFVEQLTLAIAGGVLGALFSFLGVYLSSLAIVSYPQAANAIRAIFYAIALLLHGFYRSYTPRMFLFVLVFIIMTTVGLTSTSVYLTSTMVTQLFYPLLMGCGCVLVANLCIFPEFSSAFLGATAIESLHEATEALKKAGSNFTKTDAELEKMHTEVANNSHSTASPERFTKAPTRNTDPTTQAELTSLKPKLRSKLSQCQKAQSECNFEIAYGHLPPSYLSVVSNSAMNKLIAHTIAVIGACETRFALLGDEKVTSDSTGESNPHTRPSSRDVHDHLGQGNISLEMLKPQKEIEFGDARLLRYLINRVKRPYLELRASAVRASEVVMSCIAFAYDVPHLPSGVRPPSGIIIEELDRHCEDLQSALHRCDVTIASALEGVALLQEMKDEELEFMPREEIFLVSSFLLNSRQAATQINEMLQHCRFLVQERNGSGTWRKLFMPEIHWQKWLYSGDEEDESIPARGRKAASRKHFPRNNSADGQSINRLLSSRSRDEEESPGIPMKPNQRETTPQTKGKVESPIHEATTRNLRMRGKLADILDWIQQSEDLSYAFKLSIAVFLVTFPAFIHSLHPWWSTNRASWASLQLLFVFEVAIGNSVQNFIVRAIGTTLGCLWGWAAFAARNGDPFVCTAMLLIGFVPSVYVTLATEHPKAGQVGIVSMSVVALSTELPSVPGTATENFLRRWIAFLIGGVLALLVSMTLLPTKSRTRMVDSLAKAIRRISDMEGCIAYGIEEGTDLKGGFPEEVFAGFKRASAKANEALDTADMFLPFCTKELRLKGTFKNVAEIYKEIIFVLHQIIDRMDNLLQLRIAYGSGPLEEFNSTIFLYRRNVAAAIMLVLYATHEALTTKFPLPQFMPSARLAYLRLINRIRKVLRERSELDDEDPGDASQKLALRRKYLSWNASSAAQAEVIEYLEELTSLTKLLMGANEFRSGLFSRSTLHDFAMHAEGPENGDGKEVPEKREPESEAAPASPATPVGESLDNTGLRKRVVSTAMSTESEVPITLRRIQSRKQEAGLKKQRSNLS